MWPKAFYQKTFTHKRVHDGIDKAIGHCQPMAANVQGDERVELCFTAIRDEVVVEQKLVQFNRCPTEVVQQNDYEHYFDCLFLKANKQY